MPSPVLLRVDAVLNHFQQEGLPVPSVSEVCKLAEVSRATLYANYPELIDLIKLRKSSAPMRQRVSTSPLGRAVECRMLKEQVRGLVLACLELQQENIRLRAEIASLQNRLKNRGVRTSRSNGPA